mmetsp:Transcript_22401/g.39606  ORF Transcript_22401/g.39606 Transcript_22401/m.39606 type:complete len:83 (-) Transcript_22401:1056-1304(-)
MYQHFKKNMKKEVGRTDFLRARERENARLKLSFFFLFFILFLKQLEASGTFTFQKKPSLRESVSSARPVPLRDEGAILFVLL